jgi:hypothetical protein
VALAGIWVFGALRGAGRVLLLHHLMTGLLSLKCLAVLVLSIDYHYRNITGHPGGEIRKRRKPLVTQTTGWTIAFFALNALRYKQKFCV